MAEYKFLLYRSHEGTATISLNRPEVYNALNDEITYELQDAFRLVSKDDRIRGSF
jgi:2-(1,2-epoxy-1,2-dihydrophenyl)acetyl-CoA isomerase